LQKVWPIDARRLANRLKNRAFIGDFMFKKLLTVAVLGMTITLPLLAGGCASTPGAYGLTGTDRQMTAQEKARYTDQKGNFHADWIGEAGR
jgi:hypothetical protein